MSLADKVCCKCGETKPRTEFGIKTAAKDGRTARCKTCLRADAQLTNTAQCANYRAKHREQYRNYQRAYNARWVKKNPEKRAEHQRRSYQTKSALANAPMEE